MSHDVEPEEIEKGAEPDNAINPHADRELP